MNKNKIIFAIIGVLLLIGIIYGAFALRGAGSTSKTTKTNTGDFSIWILGDNAEAFKEYLNIFAEQSGNKGTFIVESFDDLSTYKNALMSALFKGEAPDVFMMSSSDVSAFDDLVLALDPSIISPNDFRKNFYGVLGDELIITAEDDTKTEYLKGVPIGFESLGIYYNRRYFNSTDLETWDSLNSALVSIKEKSNNIIPLGIGNGSGVEGVADIFSAFLALSGGKDIRELETQVIDQALQTYLSFGEKSGENAYDSLSYIGDTKTNLDYFATGEIGAVIGFPRMLQEIDKKGYKKQFLLAAPFPQYVGEEIRNFIHYNYFVINSGSTKTQLAQQLLAYMTTEQGQKEYIKLFPYYIPTLVSLENAILEQKINPDYNIVYKDFHRRDAIMSSFVMGNEPLYASRIVNVLDAGENAKNLFEKLQSYIICSTAKVKTLTNLSSSCK